MRIQWLLRTGVFLRHAKVLHRFKPQMGRFLLALDRGPVHTGSACGWMGVLSFGGYHALWIDCIWGLKSYNDFELSLGRVKSHCLFVSNTRSKEDEEYCGINLKVLQQGHSKLILRNSRSLRFLPGFLGVSKAGSEFVSTFFSIGWASDKSHRELRVEKRSDIAHVAMNNEAAEDLKPLHWDLRSKVGEWDPKCKNAGPCRVAGCGVRPVHSPLTFDLDMRLGTWDSELSDPCPQLAGECGGTWVASGAKGGPVGRGPIFTLDLAPCDNPGSPPSPTSPRVRIIPSVSKKLVLAYRDKESLVEEIIDLKRAVQEQQMHLRHHKIQASIIEMENRKMIRDIEDMEKPNCQSKSTKPQGTVRLRAKITGLKNKIGVLQVKAEAQSEKINRLRTDARVSHTKEIEFERDVFSGEIARLTLLVKKLKQLCNHASTLEDRSQIGSMTSKVKSMEDQNKKLEEENAKLEKEMAKVEHNLRVNRIKAGEDMMEARNAEKKCRDLEHKNIRMAAAIERSKKNNKQLAKQLRKTEKAYKKAKGSFF